MQAQSTRGRRQRFDRRELAGFAQLSLCARPRSGTTNGVIQRTPKRACVLRLKAALRRIDIVYAAQCAPATVRAYEFGAPVRAPVLERLQKACDRHDESIVEAPEPHARAREAIVADGMREGMSRHVASVPVVVDHSIRTTWSEGSGE